MSKNTAQVREQVGPFQFFTLVLSIYVLTALFVETVFKLPADVREILRVADHIICFVFLFDFVLRFRQARDKKQFMKWGWIDLLSSIPMLEVFRYGRIVRVVRVLRILRAIRSTKVILFYLFKNKTQGTFSLVSTISVILVIVGAIAMLLLEKGVDGSNINNAPDALWWSFVTITTVGYGDYYPVTYEGRIVAAVLMTAGVGLFGTFTGFVASWFLEEDQDKKEQHVVTNLKNEVSDLKSEIAELKEVIMKNT